MFLFVKNKKRKWMLRIQGIIAINAIYVCMYAHMYVLGENKYS